MSFFERDGAQIHYHDEGTGVPVLLLAQGGMNSAREMWRMPPWNPRSELISSNRLVGMDQRNTGRSTGPVSADDGWQTYTGDQLALLDHLGIEQCHLIGTCIGGPFIGGLLKRAPERFISAVMLQPVGIDDNRSELHGMFDRWMDEIGNDHPAVTPRDWQSFRSNMWDGEFLLTASEGDVAQMQTPLLVLMGDDVFRPESTSRAIAKLAPNASLIERWKEGRDLRAANASIKHFLHSNETKMDPSAERPVW